MPASKALKVLASPTLLAVPWPVSLTVLPKANKEIKPLPQPNLFRQIQSLTLLAMFLHRQRKALTAQDTLAL